MSSEQRSARIDLLQQVLRLISLAQKQAEVEATPDNPFMRTMRDFFDADGCIFIFFEGSSEHMVTKKEIGRGPDWRVTSELEFEKGLLYNTLQITTIQEFTVPTEHIDFFPSMDCIRKIPMQTLICGPVLYQDKKIGVIGLVNPRNYSVNTDDRILFQLFLTAFAGQCHAATVIKEMHAVDEDLKVSRLQLLNSRNALRSLFDNIPDSFYMVDGKYKLKAVNRSRANRTGKLPRDLVGRICHEVLFGLKDPCPDCVVGKVFSSGIPGQLFGHSRAFEKNSREWDIKCFPVFNAEDAVEEVILLEQDVTDKLKMEDEMIQNERLLAIGQLAAGVAHEINNPLTSILANSQILLLDLNPEQADLVESVTLIEMAARRATKVVENLQTMVRKERFEFFPFDLNESVQNALMLVSHEFMVRQISIRFTPGSGMPPIVASLDHLQGVWINLIMNAIESIDKDQGEIKIATLFDDGKFYVEIKDTGVGITEENLDRIFEPFFSTKKSGHGTGLGLSLAKRVIQAHDGQILVESAPGQGTRFTIILPARTAEELSKVTKGDLTLI